MNVQTRNLFFAVGAILASGCGSELAPVKGQVTFDGKPLNAGTVTFYPVTDGTPGYASVVDGNYAARTGTKAGLKPGEYRVTVTAYGPLPASSRFKEEPPPLLTPLRYSRPETSGLRYSTSLDGDTFNIVLDTR
jgi:hypothetical protein